MSTTHFNPASPPRPVIGAGAMIDHAGFFAEAGYEVSVVDVQRMLPPLRPRDAT